MDGPLTEANVPAPKPPETPGQKTTSDVKRGMEGLRTGIQVAFDQKCEEYAGRILGGEDPKNVNVPRPLQKQVEAVILSKNPSYPTSPGKQEEKVDIDFGTSEDGIEAAKQAASAALKVQQETAGAIDLGTSAEEIEQTKSAAREKLAREIEKPTQQLPFENAQEIIEQIDLHRDEVDKIIQPFEADTEGQMAIYYAINLIYGLQPDSLEIPKELNPKIKTIIEAIRKLKK